MLYQQEPEYENKIINKIADFPKNSIIYIETDNEIIKCGQNNNVNTKNNKIIYRC